MTRYERQEFRTIKEWQFNQEVLVSDSLRAVRGTYGLENEFAYLAMKAIREISRNIILKINSVYKENWDTRNYEAFHYDLFPDKIKVDDIPTFDCTTRRIITVSLDIKDVNEIRRKLRDYTNLRESRSRENYVSQND